MRNDPTADPAARQKYYFQCPNCGNDEEFLRPTDGSGLGCTLLAFGGFVPALIYNHYRKQRVQCLRCMHVFQQPPLPTSGVETFAGAVQSITLVLVAAAVILYGFPELKEVLPPGVPIMSVIEEAVASRPRVAAYVLVGFVVSMLGASVIAAWLGMRGMRREMGAQYRLRPPTADEMAKRKERELAQGGGRSEV